MANWRLAKSLETLRKQINSAFPARSKISDGTIGNLAHSKRKSEHNPNSAGAVCAFDCTHDPINGIDCQKLAAALVASRDPRIRYVIWNGRITSDAKAGAWKAYKGANTHNHHLHLSVNALPKFYDDASAWDLSIFQKSKNSKVSTETELASSNPSSQPTENSVETPSAGSAINSGDAILIGADAAQNTDNLATAVSQKTTEQTATGKVETTVEQNSFQAEKKDLPAPASDGSTGQAAKVTVLGITVPAIVLTAFGAIGNWINNGVIDLKAIFDLLIRFFSENTRYIFYLIITFITFLAVKKVMKQISFIVNMVVNSLPNLHDINVVPGEKETK